MAKCAICEKAAHFGNNVSHSHRRSTKCGNPTLNPLKLKQKTELRKEDVRLYFLLKKQQSRKSVISHYRVRN